MPTHPRRTLRTVLGSHPVLLSLAALLLATPASASDITVLTAGAFKPVLLDLTAAYEARTHETVAVTNDTAGGVSARVARGEEIDLVIMPDAVLNTLAAQGKIVTGSVAKLAKSGIGVVIKKGATPPDISTVEAFKRTLLAAPSIAYIDPASGGSSGIYLSKLFERLGIADALMKKTVLVPGGLAASRVDDGEASLALQQISELHAVSGVTFVGPLPEEIQNYTVYAGGIPTSARRPAAGRALLAFLRGENAATAVAARGLEQP
jgi:molybdate transport system substrate-binding protein